jgi:hypothetical protein
MVILKYVFLKHIEAPLTPTDLVVTPDLIVVALTSPIGTARAPSAITSRIVSTAVTAGF